jgi:hypothetical protein
VHAKARAAERWIIEKIRKVVEQVESAFDRKGVGLPRSSIVDSGDTPRQRNAKRSVLPPSVGSSAPKRAIAPESIARCGT